MACSLRHRIQRQMSQNGLFELDKVWWSNWCISHYSTLNSVNRLTCSSMPGLSLHVSIFTKDELYSTTGIRSNRNWIAWLKKHLAFYFEFFFSTTLGVCRIAVDPTPPLALHAPNRGRPKNKGDRAPTTTYFTRGNGFLQDRRDLPDARGNLP